MMSPLEIHLVKALNNLVFSADQYIEDGSWIDILDRDITKAREVIELYKQVKKERTA